MTGEKQDETQDNGGNEGGLQTESEASLSITRPEDSTSSESSN